MKCGARDQGALADGGEDLVSWLVFPAVACRETEIAADIVELLLNDELHIRGEIDRHIRLKDVDRDVAGGQIDPGRDVMRREFDEVVITQRHRKIGFEVAAIVETAAFRCPRDDPGPTLGSIDGARDIGPLIFSSGDGDAAGQFENRRHVLEMTIDIEVYPIISLVDGGSPEVQLARLKPIVQTRDPDTVRIELQ